MNKNTSRGWIACSLAVFMLLTAMPRSARADRADDGGGLPDVRPLLRQGRVELSAGGGLGVFNSQEYLLLVLGGAYCLSDGLSAGVTGEAWLGSSPSIGDLSPQVRYVFLDVPWPLKPYAGSFYRRTFFDRREPPIDSVGARAGLVVPFTRRAYATGGLVYEHYFSCDTSFYSHCDQVYPEIGVAVTF